MRTKPASWLGVLSWSLDFGPEKKSWERYSGDSLGTETKLLDYKGIRYFGLISAVLGTSLVFPPSKGTMEHYQDQVNKVLYFLLHWSLPFMGYWDESPEQSSDVRAHCNPTQKNPKQNLPKSIKKCLLKLHWKRRSQRMTDILADWGKIL